MMIQPYFAIMLAVAVCAAEPGTMPGLPRLEAAANLPTFRLFLYLVAHANNSKAAFNEGYDLYAAETDAALETVKPLGKFFERTLVSPANPAVMSPCFLEDAGRLCMFFNIGARLKNKIALAIAEAPREAGQSAP
jgi:hypothetical protein